MSKFVICTCMIFKINSAFIFWIRESKSLYFIVFTLHFVGGNLNKLCEIHMKMGLRKKSGNNTLIPETTGFNF